MKRHLRSILPSSSQPHLEQALVEWGLHCMAPPHCLPLLFRQHLVRRPLIFLALLLSLFKIAASVPVAMGSRCLCYQFLFLFFIIHVYGQCDIPPLTLAWSNTTVSQDGLAVTRGIEIGIGTPIQIFAFRPETTLNNTRINNVLDCGSASNDTCVGAEGGVFTTAKSSTYSVSIKAQWNGSQIDEEDSTGSYVYLNDYVDFQTNGHVYGFPLVMDSEPGGGKQAFT